MRKNTSKVRSRLITAAVATCAASAALLATPGAAFAVAFTTLSPTAGPSGIIVNVTSSGLWTTTTPVALFVPTTVLGTSTCPTTYAAPTAPAVAAVTVNKVDNNTLSITVPALTLGTNGAPKQYSLCTYSTSASAVPLINDGFFMATAAATLSPLTGASGGGNTVALTVGASVVLPTPLGSTFLPKSAVCPLKYTVTPASGIQNGTVTRTSDTVASVSVPLGVAGAGTTASQYGICLYNGSTAASSDLFLTTGATYYSVTLPAVSLSNAVGAGGDASPVPTLVVSSASNFLTGVAAPQALFSAAVCPATYVATAGYFNPVLKSANNRGAVTVPANAKLANGVLYNICIYNGSTADASRLLASAPYTVATPPDADSISPLGGSSLGGDTITISGTNFPTAAGSIQATLGGLPLTGVTPVDSNTFTATTPAHAAETGVPLVVTTTSGTSTLTASFNYVNGISISPNTASHASSSVWVDVKGVGFESLAFDPLPFAANTGSNDKARIYLVDARGACVAGPPVCTGTTAYTPASATAGPIAECKTPAVISGTELFCKLDLSTGALDPATHLPAAVAVVPNGTYTLTVVSSGDTDATGFTQSVISSDSTFTVADF